MASKNYDFRFGRRTFKVAAEPDGEHRYMVRMAETTQGCIGYVRVGYLTGANRRWVAEPFGAQGKTPGAFAASAKEACFGIARWALTQSAFMSASCPRSS